MEKVAVLSDIHGNRWALEAVLADIKIRGITWVINLGDSLYGPLDPEGTAELLRASDIIHINGNEDRFLFEAHEKGSHNPSVVFTLKSLSMKNLEWLRNQPSLYSSEKILAFHGTPDSDKEYLLENVTPQGVFLSRSEKIESVLRKWPQPLVLCGHSHIQRTVFLTDNQLVVNPGSVGLPAYTDNQPYHHSMEAGSPHARFAVINETSNGWSVEQVAIPYKWTQASMVAKKNGRSDWAFWVETGRAKS